MRQAESVTGVYVMFDGEVTSNKKPYFTSGESYDVIEFLEFRTSAWVVDDYGLNRAVLLDERFCQHLKYHGIETAVWRLCEKT